MTNEEAILEIERFIEVMQNDLRYYEPVGEALKMAMDALEKQIPKKPNYIYYCPFCSNCNSPISSINDYCGKCGQKIVWKK